MAERMSGAVIEMEMHWRYIA